MQSTRNASPGVYEVVAAVRPTSLRRIIRPGGRLTIGRNPDNDLVVPDESVSRYHARLEWQARTRVPQLVDLGSLNGTFVGGVRVLRSAVGEWTAIRVGAIDLSVTLQHPALIPATGATLVRMFDEWAPDEQGEVDGAVALQELLLSLERDRRTVSVSLRASRLDVSLVFAGGQVIRASAAGLTGRDALRHLLAHAPAARYVITTEVQPFEGAAPVSVRDVLRELAGPTRPTARLQVF